METPLEYERFQTYGFSVDYAKDSVVEFNPKSSRLQGDVALKSPRGYKIFLSWGDLAKVKNLRGVEGHADYSIERMKGSREATIKDVRRESATVGGHSASFNEVRIELIKRGIFFNRTVTPQVVRSLHVHCDVSGRYFVLYGPAAPERSSEQGEVMERMVKSFLCH